MAKIEQQYTLPQQTCTAAPQNDCTVYTE